MLAQGSLWPLGTAAACKSSLWRSVGFECNDLALMISATIKTFCPSRPGSQLTHCFVLFIIQCLVVRKPVASHLCQSSESAPTHHSRSKAPCYSNLPSVCYHCNLLPGQLIGTCTGANKARLETNLRSYLQPEEMKDVEALYMQPQAAAVTATAAAL